MPLWQRSYEWQGRASARSVREISDGGLLVQGPAWVADSPWAGLLLLRLDRNGLVRAPCPLHEPIDLLPVDLPLEVVDVTVPERGQPVTVEDTLAVAVDLEPTTWSPCAGTTPRPPLEVSPPGSFQPLVFSDRVTLTWEPAPMSGSESFNLYRGDLEELARGTYGRCLRSEVPANTDRDQAEPVGVQGWFYLVSGRNAAGEGPIGASSEGAARTNGDPCP